MQYVLNDRLKNYCLKKNMSNREFADLLGIGETRISKWFNNDENFPLKHLELIAEKCSDLNIRWFLIGKGSMFEGGKKPATYFNDDLARVISDGYTPPKHKCTNPECLKLISELENRIARYEWLLDEIKTRKEHPPEKHASGGVDPGKRAC